MRRLLLLTSLGLAAAGCTAMRSAPAEDSFPERFYATQVLKIAAGVSGSTAPREILASVRREHDDIEIVFLDPVWQKPLLKASCLAGQFTVATLAEGAALGVPGEEIVATARDVFGWSGTLDANGGAEWQTRSFFVQIREMAGDRPCRFPRIMELRPRLPDAPTITILTVDWGCPGL